MKESAVLKAVEEALQRLLPALTASLTAEVERQLQAELAGTQTYHRKREPKDDQIVEKFNGRNAAEVARDLGVSRRTVYRAISRRLKASREKL